jgi:tellurite methyltransferase
MNDPRTTWNNRWRDKADDPWEPDPWLLKIRPLLPGGRVLDIACGRGRNTLFLAEQGMSVTAIDVSEEALAQLASEAARRNLPVKTRWVDLEADPQLPDPAFDVVLDFFYLHRPILPQLRRAVRPGGVAVLRTFSSAGSFPGGPDNPDFVLSPGELLEIFVDWEILLHEEGIEPSRKGGSLAGIVARRPESAAETENEG